MELLMTGDTTSLSYWFNWRVLLCATWVFTPMFVASYLIWKYERSRNVESEGGQLQQQSSSLVYNDIVWRPCLKEIHPIFLMIFRVVAFSLLLVALTFDVVAHGGGLFYYYTQWTFTLVTIYFGMASILSMYGCYHYHKTSCTINGSVWTDMEHGLYAPLTYDRNVKEAKVANNINYQGIRSFHKIPGFWDHLFQVLFQMTAGAVMLTDSVYWLVILPFLTIKDYEPNFLTIVAHSLNAVLLLGDTMLNCLPFPWFRMSYFILWTGGYVIFQWTIHACVPIWWPYPFLDLSSEYAPVWYLLVASLHLPCYGVFVLVVKLKQFFLSKWLPQSCQCLN